MPLVISDVEMVCRLVIYAIDTSDPENMTIERCGRLPLERGNASAVVRCNKLKKLHVTLIPYIAVGPLPLLLIPIYDIPETFILITVSSSNLLVFTIFQ